MRSKFLTLLAVFSILMIVGCPSPGNHNSGSSDTKITSLQAVVDKASAGSTINLSQYGDITDWNVTINKSVTIANGDLKTANITVSADGVTLQNVTGSANVTTNNSMKISGSSIANLTIGNAASANASQIISRGNSLPVVSFVSVKITANITVNVKAVLIIENSTSANLSVSTAAAETKLTLRGSDTKITTCSINAAVTMVLQSGAAQPTNTGSGNVKIAEMESVSANKVYWTDNGNNFTEITPENDVYIFTVDQTVDLWSKWLEIAFDYNLNAGQSGIVSFDVMTDKPTYIVANPFTTFCRGNSKVIKTSTEWNNVFVQTGKYKEGFSKLFVELSVQSRDNPISIFLKNIKFTKNDDNDTSVPSIMTHSYSYTSLESVSFTNSGDSVSFKSDADDGELCINIPVEENNLYRVSYKITAEEDTNAFNSSVNINQISEGYTCWWSFAYQDNPDAAYQPMNLKKGQETTVVAYVACAKDHWWLFDRAEHRKNVDTNKQPYMRIWIHLGNANTITVKDIKAESVTLTRLQSEAAVRWQYNNELKSMDNSFTCNSAYAKGKMVIFDKDNKSRWWSPVNRDGKIILSTNCSAWDGKSVEGVRIDALWSLEDCDFCNNNPNFNDYDFESIFFVPQNDSDVTLKVNLTDEWTLHFTKQ